ncbi:MAG: glycosyltransferase family 4 protein, partial [Thermoanaerobaculia bacterium]|nr:glycosyltransferase family 4 protein [Thermoanaerobaculia bacterium]
MKHLRPHLDLLKALGSRILIFAETFFPLQGGSERVGHNFATCLAENGWDPLVYCPSVPGDRDFDAAVPYDVLRDPHWGELRRIDRDATGTRSRVVRLRNAIHSTKSCWP